MATKLKNISCNIWVKLAVFALSAALLVSIITGFFSFLSVFYTDGGENYSLDLGFESLFADDVYHTETYESMLYSSLYSMTYSYDSLLSGTQFNDIKYSLFTGDALVGTTDFDTTADPLEKSFIIIENGVIRKIGKNIPPSMQYSSMRLEYADGTLAQSIVVIPSEGASVVSFPYDSPSLYIEFEDSYFTDVENLFDNSAKLFKDYIYSDFLPPFVFFMLCFVYLCIAAGHKSGKEGINLMLIDRLWTELTVCALPAVLILGFFFGVTMLEELYYGSVYPGYSGYNVILFFMSIIAVVTYTAFVFFFLSVLRKFKAKCFISTSLTYKVLRFIVNIPKNLSRFISLFLTKDFKEYQFCTAFHKFQVRYITFSLVMVILFFFFLFTYMFPVSFAIFLVEIAVTIYYIRHSSHLTGSMTRLLHQIDMVSSGDLTYDAHLSDEDFLKESSDKLSNIGEGLNEALDREMKSERMKIELITNVSHDLKTPLTSIISYIDLLKKEDLDDVSRDYANILSQKAERLKSIVSDLFDLAKSTSGNADLNIEKLDFTRLTNQMLGELDDRIVASGMVFKTNIPDYPIFISGDGKKLSRALQNVFDNALKYSLKGSRIFVNLLCSGSRATLTVINTSAFEMDFSADEILQRFTRGDKSRSTEGSGLGLSIAKSFTEICGGTFSVHIDGDQFKTVFEFDAECGCPETEKEEQPEAPIPAEQTEAIIPAEETKEEENHE